MHLASYAVYHPQPGPSVCLEVTSLPLLLTVNGSKWPFFIFYSYRSPYRLAAKWKRTQDSSCVGEQTPHFLMWPITQLTASARVSHTVRHCVRLWSHFSWAHIPWGIHTRYTHNPTGVESECSSLCPVGAPRSRETHRYLCLLTHRPRPRAQTSWQCRFLCKPQDPLLTHTQRTHTNPRGEPDGLHHRTCGGWTVTSPTVQSSTGQM